MHCKVNLKTHISALLLLICLSAKSQDISKYLDDGVHRTAKHIISIGYDVVTVSIPIKYEKKVFKGFSYVIAIAPFLIEKQRWYDSDPSIHHTGVGFSASIRPKFYPKAFPERGYFSLYPQFTLMNGKLFTDVLFSFGYQRIIFRKLVFSPEIGCGFRFYKDTNSGIYDENETLFIPHFPVSVNLGFLF